MSSKPIFLGHDIYRHSSYGQKHPLRIPRVSTVMDLTRALGWLPREQFVTSPRAKKAALRVWHTDAYLDALEKAEAEGVVTDDVRLRHRIGTSDNPVFGEVWRRPATSAGGSLLAGELLAGGGIVHHPAGGTHHAFPDRAGGFCYLNDPALAMLSLRRNGVRRIAYIDIDAHHPDGVEHGFAHDPECLMVSVHEEDRWPRTGALSDKGAGLVYNLPVPQGLNDSEMAHVRDILMLPLITKFEPDAIVLQCGADAVTEDPLSRLSLSNNAHFEIVASLMSLATRILVLGGGGYNPWTVGRLWTGVWAVLNGFDLPRSLPDAARTVLRNLKHQSTSKRQMPGMHLFETLVDQPRYGPIRDVIVERVNVLRARNPHL